ncbi:MAG: PLP-dependent aminotransferase family protein, partial [Arenicella sp.]
KAFASGRIKVFYAVPDFHNPSGRCWSLEKRRQVAALCQKHNIVLLEDAPYRDLRFSGEQLPLVSSFCPDHSIVLHSFSKSIVPGIRVGAMVLPQRWSDAVTKIKQASDLHSNVPMQELVLQLLNHPDYPRHLQATTELYRSRYEVLAGELERELEPGSSFEPVAGGMFIWLQLPGADSMDLAAKALEQGLAVVPSESFYADATDKPAALRLNFSHTAPEEIPEAVQRLKRVIAM